jgi:hypothetical protein
MTSFLPNWTFYPLHGIEIIPDDTPIDHSLMFEDATIISNDEIEKVLLLFDQVDQETLFNIRMHLQMVGQQGDSIIIIRQPEEDVDTIRERADHRAVEITSAISNILLMYSNYYWTCCLADEIYHIRHMMSIILHPKKKFRQSIEKIATRGWLFVTPSPPFRITRKDLHNKLFSNKFQDLSSYIFTPFYLLKRKGLKKTIKEKISAASIHLYRCINSPTPELQLVGAVTSIEILLKSQQEKYEQVGIRLEHLISSYAFNFYTAQEVFQTRHNCVHAGQKVTKGYAYLAIRLATNCLANYSIYAKNFDNAEQILDYLKLFDSIHSFIKKHNSSEVIRTLNPESLIMPPPDIIDPLPFFLSNFALTPKYFDKKTRDEQKQQFALYTSILSLLRDISILEALNILSTSNIYNICPFESVTDFEAFWKEKESFLLERAKDRIASIDKYGWPIHKYKWKG